jgi:LmbE family N-acetylglucosaminyl deacetylase
LRLLDDTPATGRNDVLDDAAIERILVVTAHPDDVDFGAAGTVATWTKAGYAVTYCIVTNGDAGGFDPDVPRSEIAGIRQAEQRAAAAEVGVTDVRFLGHADGRVVATIELRRDISRVIRQVRPQRVLTQSPERNYERIYASHPDHLAVGEATLCAVYPDARNPFAHTDLADEGHEAWAVSETWLMASPGAGHAVDVTDVYDLKLAALQCHVSQLPGVPEDLDTMLRGWLGANAAAAGMPEGRLAEAFQIIDTA